MTDLVGGTLLTFELEGTARLSASVADIRCEIGGRVEFGGGRFAVAGVVFAFTDGGGRESDELDDGGAGGLNGAGK